MNTKPYNQQLHRGLQKIERKPEILNCLRCSDKFESENPTFFKLCITCRTYNQTRDNDDFAVPLIAQGRIGASPV